MLRFAIPVFLLLLAATAHAQIQPFAPGDPPLPPPRPPEAASAAPEAAREGEGEVADVPLPPVRPSDLAGVVPVPDSEEGALCLRRLGELGAVFEPRPALSQGSCGAPAPVLLSRLPDGVAVEPATTTTCPMAEALARWSREFLVPEAKRHLASEPEALVIGTGYECRNQRSGGKPSEHAFANAVDVMAVRIKGRAPVPVAPHPEAAPEGAFQAAIRRGACLHFTTVLGPGSDAAHADHLHLDLRGRKGAYRICQ